MSAKDKTTLVAIYSVDSIISLTVSTNIIGQELIDIIFSQKEIEEKHWFGLQYNDQKDNIRWLDLKKKVHFSNIKPFPDTFAHFKFGIQYYPESLNIELIQTSVKSFFFKSEVAKLITDEEIAIFPEHRVLIAVAYACYVSHEHPGMDPEKVIEQKFDKFFPEGILSKFSLSKKDWLSSINSALQLVKSQHFSEIMMKALECMEQCPTYGVSYFPIKNKNNTSLLLGVDCYGLTIYKPDDRINPKVAFLWSEIYSVAYTGSEFVIKPSQKDSSPLIIYTHSARQNDEILSLIAGNHMNFLRRRQPDVELNTEMKLASMMEESAKKEKERYEKQMEAKLQYEASVNEIVSNSTTEESFKKLEGKFNDVKTQMENQIKYAAQVAEKEEKKRTIEYARTTLNSVTDTETSAPKDDSSKEVNNLTNILKELEIKHKKDISNIDTLRKNVSEITPKPSVSYEEVKKKKVSELVQSIKMTGTMMRNKSIDNSMKSSQVQTNEKERKTKFETLKILRKNNTKARIEEFESF